MPLSRGACCGSWACTAPQVIAETRNRLAAAVTARADGRGRTRSQIQLARLIMSTGDPIEAAALGTQALDWAGMLRSGHIVHGLRNLRHLAEPHANLTEVSDLRDRIDAATAV